MTFGAPLVLASLGVMFAGLVKGGTGLGFPLIATPIVAAVIDARTAVVVTILPNIVLDILQVTRGRPDRAWWRRFRWLLVCGSLGVILGSLLLTLLRAAVLSALLGSVAVAFVLYNLSPFRLPIPPEREAGLIPVAGLFGGLLGGLTNAMGLPVAILLGSLGLDKREFVRTISAYFLTTKVIQLVSVTSLNLMSLPALGLSVVFTLPGLAGLGLGFRVQDRLSGRAFRSLVYAIIGVSGLSLLARAFAG